MDIETRSAQVKFQTIYQFNVVNKGNLWWTVECGSLVSKLNGSALIQWMKGETLMSGQPLTIDQIRTFMDKNLGKKVVLTVNHSRKKKTINRGIVAETYPRHFVVKLDKTAAVKNASYTYADLLTKTVELEFQEQDRVS